MAAHTFFNSKDPLQDGLENAGNQLKAVGITSADFPAVDELCRILARIAACQNSDDGQDTSEFGEVQDA